MNGVTSDHRRGVIGNPNGNFWLYDSKHGFDLTHPSSPTASTTSKAVSFSTKTLPVTIYPAKSALVIVDMQNFFLSTELGRSPNSKGLEAQQKLLEYAIPAARKAGIRIIWLNWGLTKEEIDKAPPAMVRCFGFESVNAADFGSETKNTRTEAKSNPRIYKGLGNDMGTVKLKDGSTVNAGKLLMRDQWNTNLTPELSQAYEEGLKANPPDVWIHKNRMSGLWGDSTLCTEFLDKEGIKTLLFTGVNTDQCVGGSLTDAFSKGYDCIMLTDGAATSSPEFSQQCFEYNTAGLYGFGTDCESFWKGVNQA